MASDGGPMYPYVMRRECSDGTYENYEVLPGMSVRDGFAMEIIGRLYPRVAQMGNAELADEAYSIAQAMTDEKLQRDKANRDEGTDDGKPAMFGYSHRSLAKGESEEPG